VLGFACTPDDSVAPLKYEYVGVRPQAITRLEGAGTFSVDVFYGGTLENPSGFTVDYIVSGGTYGADYTIVGAAGPSGTVTIPAGAAGSEAVGKIMIVPDEDAVQEPSVNLVVTISNSSNGLVVGQYPLKDKINVTINDDDCDFIRTDFIGDFDALEPGYGTYTVTFSEDPGDANAIIADNFWDFGGVVTYVFDPSSNLVTLPTQDVIMGGTTYVIAQGAGASIYDDCANPKTFKVPYTVTRKSDGELVDDNVHTFTKQ
jgi:hypothetical protein